MDSVVKGLGKEDLSLFFFALELYTLSYPQKFCQNSE